VFTVLQFEIKRTAASVIRRSPNLTIMAIDDLFTEIETEPCSLDLVLRWIDGAIELPEYFVRFLRINSRPEILYIESCFVHWRIGESASDLCPLVTKFHSIRQEINETWIILPLSHKMSWSSGSDSTLIRWLRWLAFGRIRLTASFTISKTVTHSFKTNLFPTPKSTFWVTRWSSYLPPRDWYQFESQKKVVYWIAQGVYVTV
jgi:hypothetical protein